jgi:polyisoprenoid-binding protein YceI
MREARRTIRGTCPKEQAARSPFLNVADALSTWSKTMRTLLSALLILFVSVRAPLAIGQAETTARPDTAETITIEHGTATFSVDTNMPGVTVKGKSEALHANVQIRRAAEGLTLEHIEAWLPVKTLGTGISLRDEHMRRYVFTTSSGEVPDLRFEGRNTSCPGVAAGHEATCNISGTLTIRGVARTFSMALKIREANGATAFRTGGDARVRLSDYGIEQPSQFGVKTANDIQIHLEIPETTVTPAPMQSSAKR